MHRTGAMLSVCFCAGMLGALATRLFAWLAVRAGMERLSDILLQPNWHLLSGGLWGLVYFITVAGPRSRSHWIRKGLWAAIPPVAWHLLYFFPNQTDHGVLGLGLGIGVPLLVVGHYLIWGFFTGFFARLLWGRP